MKRIIYSLAVLAGLCFVYLAFNFNEPTWVAFDTWVRALLKDNALIIFFHYLGEPIVAASVGIAFVLFFALRGKDYRAMLFVVVVFAGGNGLNQLLKHIVQRPRPDIADQLTTYSFPSGHTMAGFFMLMTVGYFFARGATLAKRSIIIWLVVIILALLVGSSRVAEGRHFATDVLAGWCVGYAWFTLCVWWYERRKKYFKKRG
ncbi:MAG: phosphatase PAP2 family protein [Solibacillus sp.]